MQIFRTALKEALWVFVFSRLTILVISYISIILLGSLDCTHGIHPNPCLLSWYHWDVVAYVRIAFQGYAFTPDVAFFPLWPLLVHFGGLLLGGSNPLSYYLAALLLSNICFYFALVLLYCLLCEDFEPSLAKRAIFYLAFYPYALFFFAGYTESLFVLLCVAFFLLLRHGKPLDWWLAGVVGCLAAFTRSTGILLSIPFLVMYTRGAIYRVPTPGMRNQHGWFQRLNALVPIVLIPAAVLVYVIYLGYTKGNPFIIGTVEATDWNRHFAWIWTTYHQMQKLLFASPILSLNFAKNLLDLTFTTLPIVALILGWKRLSLHYSLFALAAIMLSISFPLGSNNPMASQPRYMMSIFPLIVVFALWGKRPHFDQLFIALGPPLFAFNCFLFVSHSWVA